MPFLLGFSGGCGFPSYSSWVFSGRIGWRMFFHFIVVPCYHVPKPRDVDKKTPNWVCLYRQRWVFWGRMEIIFPFYSGPIISGMSNLKTPSCVFWVSTELGMLRPKGFLGQDGESFPCYSCPMLSHVQKDSKLGILLRRQSWVFLGQLGILGQDGGNFPFDSGPMLSHIPKPKHFSKLGIQGYRQSLVFLASWVFWGWMEKGGYVVHFIPFFSIRTLRWFENTAPGSHYYPCYSRERHAKTEQCNYNP